MMLINDKSQLKRNVEQIVSRLKLARVSTELIWQTQADCSILSDRQQGRLGLQT